MKVFLLKRIRVINVQAKWQASDSPKIVSILGGGGKSSELISYLLGINNQKENGFYLVY
jgi:hypothetical protein